MASAAQNALGTRPNYNAQSMARALGWFSIALGVAELVAPGAIKHKVGTPGPKGLLQSYGAREIASGLAILSSENPVRMVWSRVAGDMLDLATLVPALSKDNPHRTGGSAAFAFVVAAMALDLYVAMQHDEVKIPPRHRSGLRLNQRPADLPIGYAPTHRASAATLDEA
jgi:hypothetical protein